MGEISDMKEREAPRRTRGTQKRNHMEDLKAVKESDHALASLNE